MFREPSLCRHVHHELLRSVLLDLPSIIAVTACHQRNYVERYSRFILAYLKTYALHVVQGRLFGMGQSKAHQWIHALLPVLLAALRALGDAPARSLTALAQRLGVAAADAATVVDALEEDPAPVAPVPAAAPASPLLPMTGRNGVSSVPRTLLNRRHVIAARKRTTPSKTSCS